MYYGVLDWGASILKSVTDTVGLTVVESDLAPTSPSPAAPDVSLGSLSAPRGLSTFVRASVAALGVVAAAGAGVRGPEESALPGSALRASRGLMKPYEAPSSLAYYFTIPMSVAQAGAPGAGVLEICNPSSTAVGISAWTLTNNVPGIAPVDGGLFPAGGYSIESETSGDAVTYTVNLAQEIPIEVGECVDAFYTYSSSTVPLGYAPLATAPASGSVAVQVESESGFTSLDVVGKCQGSECVYPSSYQLMSWVPTWYNNYLSTQILTRLAKSKYSCLISAFFNFDKDGNIISVTPAADSITNADLAMWNRQYGGQRRFYIGIGGATYSAAWGDLFTNPAGLIAFANNAIKLAKQVGANGVALDMEDEGVSPLPYVTGIETICGIIRANGLECALAIETGTGTMDYFQRSVPHFWQRIAKAVNFILAMSYDDWVPGQSPIWASRPLGDDPRSPQYQWGTNLLAYIAYYLANGIPANNTIIGYPAYGYGVFAEQMGQDGEHGIGQIPASTTCKSQFYDGTCIIDLSCLAQAAGEVDGVCLMSPGQPFALPSLSYTGTGSPPWWGIVSEGWMYNDPENFVVTGVMDEAAVVTSANATNGYGFAGAHTWHAYSTVGLSNTSNFNPDAVLYRLNLNNGSVPIIPSSTPTPSPTSTATPTPSASATASGSPAAPTGGPSPEPGSTGRSSVLAPVLGSMAGVALVTIAGIVYCCRRPKPPELASYYALSSGAGSLNSGGRGEVVVFAGVEPMGRPTAASRGFGCC